MINKTTTLIHSSFLQLASCPRIVQGYISPNLVHAQWGFDRFHTFGCLPSRYCVVRFLSPFYSKPAKYSTNWVFDILINTCIKTHYITLIGIFLEVGQIFIFISVLVPALASSSSTSYVVWWLDGEWFHKTVCQWKWNGRLCPRNAQFYNGLLHCISFASTAHHLLFWCHNNLFKCT